MVLSIKHCQECQENRATIRIDGTVVNLSNTLNYIQYGRHPKNYHSLGISTVNKCRNSLDIKRERDVVELDFGQTPDILKEEYLDVYEEFSQKY